MPRKNAAKFKCQKCGKAFGMAMHLGRHMATIHGQKPKQAVKRSARQRRPVSRPAGLVGRLGLRTMSLEQLVGVIAAAKSEAAGRIAEIQAAMR